MNVGILTFHRGPNYGGYLQAWHVREAVRKLGHQAEIINYQNPVLRKTENPGLRNFHPGTLRHAFRVWQKRRPFLPLVDTFSPYPFTTNPAEVNWGSFDVVLVGSDVVWDYQTPTFGMDPCYFGSHPSQQDPRFVSYAASCGPADPSKGVPEWVSGGLQRFSHLSVRDETTRRLVAMACDRETPLVVDPTWLNPDPAPQRSIVPRDPYVLVYGGALNDVRAAELRRFARGKGWKIVGAASAWKYCDLTLNGFDPFQWVDLFRNARAVVTATLHGLLYAVKANKPFLMVALPAAANKSRTVIERCGAINRLTNPTESFGPDRLTLLEDSSPPEPDHAWIEASRSYLRSALDRPPA
jgi:hypothetical protein